MNIAILTFHFVHNQGAVLQCIALRRYLEGCGHSVRVIDYRPPYHTCRYGVHRNPFRYAAWFGARLTSQPLPRRAAYTARAFARCVYQNLRGDGGFSERFERFLRQHLPMTERYSSLDALRRCPPPSDAYMVGSDQVWNAALLDGRLDPAYFLQFGDPGVRRIAYAPSTGGVPDEKTLAALAEGCRSLTAVSVRECDAAVLSAIGGEVPVVLDPTLLPDAADYAALEAANTENEPYIFVYGFETNEDIRAAVRLAQKTHHCRVINASPDSIRLDTASEAYRNYTPDTFLALVKHAACVVTNSFHGTVFSVIYRRPFITVAHTTRGGRMTGLLSSLGLECCLWGSEAFAHPQEIAWEDVGVRLEACRAQSRAYLASALGDGENADEKCVLTDAKTGGKS